MPKKTIILGVTGGIAAYKSCEIVSRLRKLGYLVKVIMTKSATEFVAPLTFETLSNDRVVTDMFDKSRGYDVEHISYAKLASAFLVAPATANFIAKLREGIADDMLSTTVLATTAPIIVCPAMNTNMYNSEAVQDNIRVLKERGVLFVEPLEGLLACGDVGRGKMEEPAEIVRFVDKLLTPNPDLRGLKFLITAGATREPVDGVRFLSNHSSGKMGCALAEAVLERGGEVVFVRGITSVPDPKGAEIVRVNTTEEMLKATLANVENSDIIIKAAAPSDYKVLNYSATKIKSDTLTLNMVKNPDIAKAVAKIKGNRKLIVFAAETENLLENAIKKLDSKGADLVVANDVTKEGAGFNTDTNIATLIKKDGSIIALDIMSKFSLANAILDAIMDKNDF